MTDARLQLIAGLRAVADFYQQHPTAYYDGLPVTLNVYIWGAKAREILDETTDLFGACRIVTDARNVTISRNFSSQVTLSLFTARSKHELRER